MQDKEGFHKVGMYLPDIVWEAVQREDQREVNMATSSLGRVLIVDDEASLVKMLRLMLSRSGYDPVGFTSADAALKAMNGGDFDLLLTDVHMPELDGIDLLRAATAIDPELVGIMMTGQGTVETAVQTMKVGALDYILKPFQLPALLPVLSRAMEVRRLRQQARRLTLQNEALTRQLEAELARAGEVQAKMLPRCFPRLPGFELAACCIPAREVGGDFYEWQESKSGELSLTVGDVMGKGMPAALLMATARATIRALELQNPPAAALELVHQAMATDLDHTNSFVTLFHAKLDVSSRQLTYVDAGHGHVFVLRANAATEGLPCGGFPLGIQEAQKYQEGVITFHPGDCLVIYSDGLVEARPDIRLQPPVLAERLQGAASAAAMVERLVDLAAVPGPPADDLTVVVLRCSGPEK